MDISKRDGVTYFIGHEVENTLMKGERTLFVTGLQDPVDIKSIAVKNDIKHIYLGASQSFEIDLTKIKKGKARHSGDQWDVMVTDLLNFGYWVTLDVNSKYIEYVNEFRWMEDDQFILMVSVMMPNIRKMNYNTTIKIDDSMHTRSNPGIWCHSLHSLTGHDKFTAWRDYSNDKEIKLDGKA